MDVKLVVANGPHRGRVIPLPPTVFLIGRAPQCHLRPHCRLVSKLHCAIACWAGKIAVRDLNSVNGTYVNGQRIRGEVRLGDSDTLRVGALGFSCRVNTDPEESFPVPVVTRGDFQWLMEMPEDWLVRAPTDTQRGSFATGNDQLGTGPEELSAGQHLRDYFRRR